MNKPDELKRLSKGWEAALRTLFEHFIPIVIGYGGNDEDLMGFLDRLEPKPWLAAWPGAIARRTGHREGPSVKL